MRGGRRWLVPAAIVAAVAIVSGAVTFVLVGDPEPAAAVGVLPEPVGTAGPDPFTTSVTVREAATLPDTVTAVATRTRDRAPTTDAHTTSIAVLTGTTPGLYGGTRDDTACDVEAMTRFLEANPDKATAWAATQDITVEDLTDYLTGLTPVVLTADTWVTNHGYADGTATPRQSILQAGTAVLVDDQGTPRARCSCGNPLRAPDTTTADPADTTTTPWDGYDPDRIVTIDPGPTTDTLTLTDLTTGDPYDQPTGTTARDEGDPGTTTTTTDDLVLATDGLGVLPFGRPGAEVEATLTDILGEPDEAFVCDFDGPEPTCTVHDPQGRFVTWGDLTVWVSKATGAFEHYTYAPYAAPIGEPIDVEELRPPASTPEGITVGSTARELLATFDGIQRYDCDPDTYEAVLEPATPDTEGRLVTALDGYVFSVDGGRVTSVAHGVDDTFVVLGCGP